MKSVSAYRAIAGVLLCATGAWLAIPTAYHEQIYFINAGGCRLATTILEKSGATPQGSVVLFHGISANKKIMSYLAQGFAEQGLRVFAPDLPGHGRSPGPFSPARAEECGESLGAESGYLDLLDEVAALVERPAAYVGSFDAEFLAVPPECLALTMRQNQKYFPMFDVEVGRLMRQASRLLQ